MRITTASPALSVRNPLSQRYPFYVLVETRGANQKHDAEKMEEFVARALEEGVVADGTISQDQNQVGMKAMQCEVGYNGRNRVERGEERIRV